MLILTFFLLSVFLFFFLSFFFLSTFFLYLVFLSFFFSDSMHLSFSHFARIIQTTDSCYIYYKFLINHISAKLNCSRRHSIFCYCFSEKIRLDIFCESLARQPTCNCVCCKSSFFFFFFFFFFFLSCSYSVVWMFLVELKTKCRLLQFCLVL